MADVTKAWAVRRTAQVLAGGVRDRVAPRHSARERRIPRFPADITADWLSGVLCPAGAQVRSVRVVEGSVGTTTRQVLELTYDEAGAAAGLPERVFAKSTTAVAQRLMLGLGGLIQGEPRFYAHVRPLLEIEAPTSYFSAADERTWRSILLLEDVVHTRGASFWKPGRRLSRQQLEDLLGAVAGWHGRLWESPRLASWRWLKTPADQMRVIDALIGLADRTRAGARRAAEVIPPALHNRGRDLHAALQRSMQLVSQGPHTYLHGDLHVANTYLTRAGAVGVCDWQVALRGSWAHDYAYIMATATEVEDRRNWEGELLDHYLEHLAAAGGEHVARDRAWLAYRRATFYPCFAWLYTLGRSRLQPNFQPEEVSLTMVRRIGAAITDLDSFGAVGL